MDTPLTTPAQPEQSSAFHPCLARPDPAPAAALPGISRQPVDVRDRSPSDCHR